MAAKRRERWYSSDGQHRIHRSAMQSSKGTRQLMSLVLLLVLTLIAIQQVSDSKRVGRVATAIGLLPNSSATPTSNTRSDPSSASPLAHSSQSSNSRLESSIAEEMPGESAMEELSLTSADPSIALQVQMLERLLAGAPQAVIAALQDRSSADGEAFATWMATAQVTLARWMDMTDSLAPEHANLVSLVQSLEAFPSPPTTADASSRFERALRLALDRVLLRQFIDNTPWRTEDRIPLIRTTERAIAMHRGMLAGWLAPEMVASLSVPQLLAQTATHRGHGVRIAGKVALIDQPASIQRDGTEPIGYGVIWLRPDDGSNQPILIHIPSEVKVPNELLAVDQPIVVTGLLAKRRAYASNRGGDVAPVIVAAAIQPTPNAGVQPNELSPVQLAVSERLNRLSTHAIWSPPVDVSGAMQRVVQRLASKLTPLESIAPLGTIPDREALATLALNEAVLASLMGIDRVAEEIELLASSGRSALPDSTLEIVRWTGTVTQATRIPVANPPFPSLEWSEVYACVVEPAQATDAPGQPWIAIASRIPLAWLDAPELRQPCVVQGISLSNASVEGTSPTLLGASVQWRLPNPTSSVIEEVATAPADLSPELNLGWQSLLRRGWNLAWVDMLESLHGQPMSARESEAFYSMLAAARFSEDGETRLQDPADEQALGIMNVIRRSDGRKRNKGSRDPDLQSVGYRTEGSVQVRRVQRIAVESLREREWLGADHYYQLDGFADIGRNRIEIQYGEGDQTVVFEREFPVTLVAARVPDGLLVESGDADASGSQAWYPRVRVDMGGWFYRVWRYKTTQVSMATDDSQSQQGPMLVVDRIRLAQALPVVNASDASPSWINATTTAIGLFGMLFIAWTIRKSLKPRR